MDLMEVLKDKIPDLLGDGSDVELQMPAITGILKQVTPLFADGFQWADVPKMLGIVVPELMEIAGNQEGKTGEEKKKFVVDAGTCIYFYFDPDWKYVPDWIERRAEKIVVPPMVEAVVEGAYYIHKKIFARFR